MKKIALILALAALVVVNLSVHYVVVRWDMTDDKRYSISVPTQQLLKELQAPLQVSILLDGELNAGFLRLKRATEEMVSEIGVYAGNGGEMVVAKQQDMAHRYSRAHAQGADCTDYGLSVCAREVWRTNKASFAA